MDGNKTNEARKLPPQDPPQEEPQAPVEDSSNKPASDQDGTRVNSSTSTAALPSSASFNSNVDSAVTAIAAAQHPVEKSMRTAALGGNQEKVSHEMRWRDMYTRLLAFRSKHGHCLVPNRFAEDSQLGFWVSAQRRQYKLMATTGAGTSALTPERIRKLEVIGFQWSSTNPHHTPWQTRYNELCQFVRKYGHAEVPIRWKENPRLSHWVSKQRHDFKLRKQRKSSRLNDEKVRLLNDVGFLWEGSRRSLKDKISLEPVAETNDAERSASIPENSVPLQPSGNQAATLLNAAAGSLGIPALAAAAAEAPTSVTTVGALQRQPPASAGVTMPLNAPIAAGNTQGAQQTLSGEALAQLLGALAPQQQQQLQQQQQQSQQPMVAALLFPLQAASGAMNLGALSAPAPPPPPPPPPVAQPQANLDVNSVVNLVAQALAPILMQQQLPQAGQQQSQFLLPQQLQPLQSQLLQQQLPFILPLQQLQQQQPTQVSQAQLASIQQPQQQALLSALGNIGSQEPLLQAFQQASGEAPTANAPAPLNSTLQQLQMLQQLTNAASAPAVNPAPAPRVLPTMLLNMQTLSSRLEPDGSSGNPGNTHNEDQQASGTSPV